MSDYVVDVGPMSRRASIDYSRQADVLLVVVNDDNASRLGTIPAKTYEAMALGRHVLGVVPRGSDVETLLESYGDATICNVADPDEIFVGLSRLVERHGRGGLMAPRP